MFNIIKSLKEKMAPAPVKAVVSNKFISSINQNHQTENFPTKNELLEEKYNLLYSQGLEALEHFASAPDNHHHLNKASDKFYEIIEIRKDKAEPYFYLSYIGYLQKNMNMTLKYLQLANLINPDIPGMDNLRKEIIQSIS